MHHSIAARRLAAAFVAIGLLLAVRLPVLAHAELVEATPAANAAVIEAPEELILTFGEPIDPQTTVIELLDAQQHGVAGLDPVIVSADGLTARVGLPELDPDVYTVSYQVVSTVDGHATAGFYAFLVDPSGAAPPPTDSASASSPSVDPFTVAARWMALAAMLVAFGTLVMWWHAGSVVAAARPPWALIGASGLAAAVGIALYLLLAARPIAEAATGTGIPFDIAAPFGWTPFAIAMRLAFVAALVSAGVSLFAGRQARGRSLVLVAGVVLAVGLAAMSFAGHAAAGGPIFATIDWIHLVAVAAWLGGLPAAFVLAARHHDGTRWVATRDMLRRHGRLALVAAPVVALTGLANSPIVLGSGRDLVASDYGNLLVVKAGLLAVALGIGAVNHLALRGRGRAAVVGLVGLELAVAALAVSAAATMVTIQPASARQQQLATTPVNPAHFFGEVGPELVHVSVSVPAPGDQVYRVILTDPDTGAPPADVQKVFLELTPPPSGDLPAQRVELSLDPDPPGGVWGASGAYTPLDGDWGLDVIVRRRGERDESTSFVMAVSEPGTPELGPPPNTGVGVPWPLAASWSLLPEGVAGWTPALVAVVALLGLGLLPTSRRRSVARGACATLAVAAFVIAGSRSLVDAANAPTARDLADQPPVVAPPDLERGAAVYRANCASCHGPDGGGEGAVDVEPAPRPFADVVPGASDAQLSYRIAYGVAGTPMPPFAGFLTPEERSDLIAYLRAVSTGR